MPPGRNQPGLSGRQRAALSRTLNLTGKIIPDVTALARGLEDGLGLIHAETTSFILADLMPRPSAQARVKTLCAEALATGTQLPTLTARDFPTIDWKARLTMGAQLGQAPVKARSFAQIALNLGQQV